MPRPEEAIRVVKAAGGATSIAHPRQIRVQGRPHPIGHQGLEALTSAGLRKTHLVQVPVDEQFRSNVPSILALGDILGRIELTPVATTEGMAIANTHFAGKPTTVDYNFVPSAVFSNPQVASVGLTEEQARAEGRDVVIGRRDFGGTAYGWALEDTTSFAKVLADPDDARSPARARP